MKLKIACALASWIVVWIIFSTIISFLFWEFRFNMMAWSIWERLIFLVLWALITVSTYDDLKKGPKLKVVKK